MNDADNKSSQIKDGLMNMNKNFLSFPSSEWNDGFRCAVDCYANLLEELLDDLGSDKKKITRPILHKFTDLIHQNRMEIHDEFYCEGGFRSRDSPFIRVRRDLSDKKNVVIEWYNPRKK